MDIAPLVQNGNPALEEHIRVALRALQALVNERAEARNRGDQAQVAIIDNHIAPAMRQVGDAYDNEEARQHWYHQAETHEHADVEEREHMLMTVAMCLGILIAAPLALAFGIVGGVVLTAGSILYGVGRVAQGLWSLLTGGML
ncbi:hypothetical protein RSAG8_05701, partial [Rhizoctonia solani AG-8 WAC10335]